MSDRHITARRPGLALVLVAALAPAAACDDSDEDADVPAPFDPDTAYEPDVTAAELSAAVTNPLFPAPVGATWTYEGDTPDGLERIEIVVEPGTFRVWDVEARIVRDSAFLDDELVEDTRDWFAQDARGHVWYLGEDTAEYEDGVIVSMEGAWKAGVDGALPGIVMLADPQVGDVYRQEYFEGEAEDYAEVISVDASVEVPAGSFTGCLKTRDLSAIEPALDEFKYYCPGVGNVLVEEGDVRIELIEYAGL